jgi:ADP-L-glycero-D-manno-heptose 6-epimerase
MIIITGGAGFIGSNLAAALEERGISRIVLVDSFGRGDKWKNVSKRDAYNIVPPENLFSFLELHKNQIRIIYHLGASSSTTETDVDFILKSNLTYSLDLLNWCSRHRVRFIYASSAATYGDGEQGFLDGYNRSYLSRLRPLNPYGWSKHLFDRIVAKLLDDQSKDYPLPPQYVGLKFFNVYGPNEYHKEGQMSVVPQFFKQIKESGTAKLFKSYNTSYPDGGQLRDFIYVNDCVNVMLWLYDSIEVSGLFNVGTGQARSFEDLAKAVFSALHRDPKIEFIEMPESLKEKYQYYTVADTDNIRAAGYAHSFTSLEEGVKEYVHRYLNQADQYR